MLMKRVKERTHPCRSPEHQVASICPYLHLGRRVARLDQPQEFGGVSFAAIIRHNESLSTESNAEAESTKHITVAYWKLQRCPSVRRRLCIWSVHSHPGLKSLSQGECAGPSLMRIFWPRYLEYIRLFPFLNRGKRTASLK